MNETVRCNLRRVQYHGMTKSTNANGMGRPSRGSGTRGRGARGRGTRGRGRAVPPPAGNDEDETLDEMVAGACSYCSEDTEEQLLQCISYGEVDVEWNEIAKWIKAPLACDKRIHLSCARKNEDYMGNDAEKASYPEIGVCKGCLTKVEAERV